MSNDSAESVIWIASYPKSGNTWVQSVIRHAGYSFGFPAEDLDVYKMMAAGKEPVVVNGVKPDIGAEQPTVLKTHAGFALAEGPHPELNLRTVGFVYVMRNPLDMLLSYINFTRITYERNKDNPNYRQALFVDLLGYDEPLSYATWSETILEDIPQKHLDHALTRFAELNTAIPGVRMTNGTWLEHCMGWHEAGERLPSVVLKYEDLFAGPEEFFALQRLFEFSNAQLTKAVHDVNQRQRDQQGKKIFYNKMSAYYYPGFFSADAVKHFLEKFERELHQLGYANLYQQPPT